jgi:hypothetical protein
MTHADAHYTIGKDHLLCQDYAEARPAIPAVILSDGCSGGGTDHAGLDVDTGVRLLTKTAFRHFGLLKAVSPEAWLAATMADTLALASRLDVDPLALYATLLVAYTHEGQAHILMAGDGVAFFRDADGGVEYHSPAFAANAPHYPLYAAIDGLEESYLGALAPGGAPCGSHELTTGLPDGTLSKATLPPQRVRLFSRPLEGLAAFGVISDGILSGVRSPDHGASGEPVDPDRMIRLLTRLTSHAGPFVARRLNRFVKDRRLEGILFSDDLALAVLAADGGQWAR